MSSSDILNDTMPFIFMLQSKFAFMIISNYLAFWSCFNIIHVALFKHTDGKLMYIATTLILFHEHANGCVCVCASSYLTIFLFCHVSVSFVCYKQGSKLFKMYITAYRGLSEKRI